MISTILRENKPKVHENKQKPLKITLKTVETVEAVFLKFLRTKRSYGVTEVTITTYSGHLKSLSRHLDIKKNINDLTKYDIEEMIYSMRSKGLSPNTIRSYTITLRAFFSWCKQEGYCVPPLPKQKGENITKDTYTDEELKILLKKPNVRKVRFPEYRTWVIINLLVNCGCRASTVRSIQIRDLDLPNNIIHARHTKNKKALVIPLCTDMKDILEDYLKIRGGENEDFLFCDEYGGELSENALRCSIKRYNTNRGLKKTSIHLFRHTFAKKYLIDCGGNAFTLQKLLGHSTLDMTRHYCEIFNADIAKGYDSVSPLALLNAKSTKLKMPKK